MESQEYFKDLLISRLVAASVLLVYSLLTVPGIHNSCLYVLHQKRYRSLWVVSFYLSALIIIVARSYICFCIIYYESNSQTWLLQRLMTVELLSSYSKIILGFTQLSSMVELTIRLNFSLKVPPSNLTAADLIKFVSLNSD